MVDLESDTFNEDYIETIFIDSGELLKHNCMSASKISLLFHSIFNDYLIDHRRFRLNTEISKWCKENKIKYRKVDISNTIRNSKNRPIDYIGKRRTGILFYRPEDAMAFKLRWL